MDDMRLDRKLQTLIDKKGWNQSDLAANLGGIAKSTVSAWFSGTSKPNLDMSLKLSRAFDVPLEYLADDAMDVPPVAALAIEEKALLELAKEVGFDQLFNIRPEAEREADAYRKHLLETSERYYRKVSSLYKAKEDERARKELARVGAIEFASGEPNGLPTKGRKGAS